MNKPKRNSESILKTVDQMKAETNYCRSAVVRIAKDAGAYIRYGRTIRINAIRFYEYLEKVYAVK